jgi:hypothetical protein
MKVARILRFGPASVITNDNLPRPEPAAGQLLVRVKPAGAGNWDALIREGKVELQPLPLTLGSELSGIVEAERRWTGSCSGPHTELAFQLGSSEAAPPEELGPCCPKLSSILLNI